MDDKKDQHTATYVVDDKLWIDGVDYHNNYRIYLEGKVVAVLKDCYVIDPLENSKYDAKREIVMFYQIDEIGPIT